LNVMVVSIGKTDESTEPPPSHILAGPVSFTSQ